MLAGVMAHPGTVSSSVSTSQPGSQAAKPAAGASYAASEHQRQSRPGSKKRKQLSWAPDDSLNKIRLFSFEEAPAMAGSTHLHQEQDQAKLAASLAQNSTRRSDLPPGFAHQPHQRNKRVRVDSRAVDAMTVQIKWAAPEKVEMDAGWGVVAGGDSKQIAEQKERELGAFEAFYPRPSSVPDSPLEPADSADALDDKMVPSIPTQPVEDDDEQSDAIPSPAIVVAGAAPYQSATVPAGTAHPGPAPVVPAAVQQPGPAAVAKAPTVLNRQPHGAGVVLGSSASPEIAAAAAAAVASLCKNGEVDEKLLAKTIAALTEKHKQQLPNQSQQEQSRYAQGMASAGVTKPMDSLAHNLGNSASTTNVQFPPVAHQSSSAPAFSGPNNAIVSSRGPRGPMQIPGMVGGDPPYHVGTQYPHPHMRSGAFFPNSRPWTGSPGHAVGFSGSRELSRNTPPPHVALVGASASGPLTGRKELQQQSSNEPVSAATQRRSLDGRDPSVAQHAAGKGLQNSTWADPNLSGHPLFLGPGTPAASGLAGPSNVLGPRSAFSGPGQTNVTAGAHRPGGPMGPWGGPGARGSPPQQGPGGVFMPRGGPRPSGGQMMPHSAPRGPMGAGMQGRPGGNMMLRGPHGPMGFNGPRPMPGAGGSMGPGGPMGSGPMGGPRMGAPRPGMGARGAWNQGEWMQSGSVENAQMLRPPPMGPGGAVARPQHAPMLQWVTRVEEAPSVNNQGFGTNVQPRGPPANLGPRPVTWRS